MVNVSILMQTTFVKLKTVLLRAIFFGAIQDIMIVVEMYSFFFPFSFLITNENKIKIDYAFLLYIFCNIDCAFLLL